MPWQEGDAIKGDTAPEVYRIEGGTRRWIPDEATLLSLGYTWAMVEVLPQNEVNQIPLGDPIASVIQAMHWRWWHTVVLLLLIAVIILVSLFPGLGPLPTSTKALWLLLMALMGITIVWMGYGITGVIAGFLIDSRNKMSLSRLQLVLWTIVVLPAFLAAAVFNFGAGAEDPLNITVPPEVWGLLGISAGSLVGSGIIKSGRDTANPAEVQQAQQAANPVAALASLNNQQVVNEQPERASISDLFKGELVGSEDHLEVGKVQMFFFTLLVIFAYAKAIAATFDNAGALIESLPALSAGMLALLAISHAGYLANKSVATAQ